MLQINKSESDRFYDDYIDNTCVTNRILVLLIPTLPQAWKCLLHVFDT